MTQFEFLSVFISLVLAFGVTDILSSWGEEIRLRNKVRHYWVHSAWSLLLIVVMIQVWWALWQLRDRTAWTFFEYLCLILPYLLAAMLAYLLTPQFDDGERDVRHYYYEISSWFFGLAAGYIGTWVLFAYLVSGKGFFDPDSFMRYLGIGLMLALALWKNKYFHAVAVVAAYLLLTFWIVTQVFRI